MQKVYVFEDTSWLDSVEDKLNEIINEGYRIDQFQVVVSPVWDDWDTQVGHVYNLIVVASEISDAGLPKELALYAAKGMFGET